MNALDYNVASWVYSASAPWKGANDAPACRSRLTANRYAMSATNLNVLMAWTAKSDLMDAKGILLLIYRSYHTLRLLTIVSVIWKHLQS